MTLTNMIESNLVDRFVSKEILLEVLRHYRVNLKEYFADRDQSNVYDLKDVATYVGD